MTTADKEILKELKLLGIKNPEEIDVESEKIKDIRNKVFRKKHTK